MNEEQQFKQKALAAGMAALNAEFRTQIERRDIEGYQKAVLQLLLNVDETWRAKNERSFFEKALDQIDNGYGAVGEKLGHDNISGHEAVKDWSNATLEDVPVDWMPDFGGRAWYVHGDNILSYIRFESKAGIIRLFPTKRLAIMYLDSQKPVELWKPEYGLKYWLIDIDGGVSQWPASGGEAEARCFDFGNCFQTIEEALAARDRVKKALKGE